MPKAKFTQEQIEEIKREKSEGCNYKVLAGKYNCSANTIWRMCHLKQKRVAPIAAKSSDKTTDKNTGARGSLSELLDQRIERIVRRVVTEMFK